jgi:hypothetical protein
VTLDGVRHSVVEIVEEGDLQVLFLNFKVTNLREHHLIVVVLLIELFLELNHLEALSTNLASVHWSFSEHVVHLFMSVRVVFYGWSHANNNSPSGIRSENKDWVVNSSELHVHDSLHLVPDVHVERTLSQSGSEVFSSVTVGSVHVGQLGGVLHSTWLHPLLEVSQGPVDGVLYSVGQSEVWSGLHGVHIQCA